MKPLTDHEIEQLLTARQRPEPPQALLGQIQQEIPEDFAVGISDIEPAAATPAPGRSRWLFAAILLSSIGGSFLTVQLLRQPELQPQARLEARDKVAVDPGESPLAEQARVAEPDRMLPPPVVPPAEKPSAEKLARERRISLRDSDPTPMAPSAPAPSAPAPSAPAPSAPAPSAPAPFAPVAEPPQRLPTPSRPASSPSPPVPPPSATAELARGMIGESMKKVEPHRPTPPPDAANQESRIDSLQAGAGTAPTAQPGHRALQSAAMSRRSSVSDFHQLAAARDWGASSYTLAKRYIRDGHLPPAEVIRVEEFINAFDYGDEPPQGESFALRAEGAPLRASASENVVLLCFHLRGNDDRIASRGILPGEWQAEVEFNPDRVAEYRLLGYEGRSVSDLERIYIDDRFRAVTTHAARGYNVTALYELKLDSPLQNHDEIAVLRLHGSPEFGEPLEFERRVTGRDFFESWKKSPLSLRLTSLVADFGEILQGSKPASGRDLDEIFRLVQQISVERIDDQEIADLASLIKRVAKLREQVR